MKAGSLRVLSLAVLLAALLVIAGPVGAQQQGVTFEQPPDRYPTSPGEEELTNITNADFNGDRRPDIAVTNTSTNSISVLLNRGNGAFGPAINTPAPCPGNVPPGTPADCQNATSPGGPRPMGIVSADFNRDGKADVAVTSPPTGSFYVFFGRGDGTFRFGQSYVAAADAGESGIRTFGITTADFNRDRRPDIAVTNLGCCSPRFPVPPGSSPSNNDTVAVFLNDPGRDDDDDDDDDENRGDPTFERRQLLSAGDSPSAVTSADFNRDGRLDLAVTNDREPGLTRPRSRDVSVYLQNRNGAFGVPPSPENQDVRNPTLFVPNAEYTAGDGPTAIASADLDGDRRPDLVVANLNSDNVSVLLNNGNGTFGQPPANYPAGDGPRAVTIADFDLDGDLDFAVPYQNNDPRISVYLNDGDGNFDARQDFQGGINSRGITSADFNRDRKPDIAAPDRSTSPDSVLVLLNTTEDDDDD